jgi:ABC-type phosphate/phosphonate transport system permease subunit
MSAMLWARRAPSRRAAVAGALTIIVGAGGIGIELYASINRFDWRQVAVMLIAISAVVVSEFIAATSRQRIT